MRTPAKRFAGGRKDLRQVRDALPPWASRGEVTAVLGAERIARKTGDWGPWEVKQLPPGLITIRGWASEVRRVHQNRIYVVLERPFDGPAGPMIHFAIRTPSTAEPPWRDMQRIKNELVGPERLAVQVCPPVSRLIDEADMYHLWVYPEGYDHRFGLHPEDRS